MKLQQGELLISENGRYYLVVECSEESVSLKRVNGYTLFSCHPGFLDSSFRKVSQFLNVNPQAQ